MIALLAVLALQDVFPFEGEEPGLEAALTGEGGLPRWTTVRDATAPSGEKVLAPAEVEKTDKRFVLAVAPKVKAEAGALWVRFKPLEGTLDRAGGLAWRYRDAKNYYVARANALEGNLRVYKVVDGRRIQLASRNVEVAAGAWHTLVVLFQGKTHAVSLDGGPRVEVEDDALGEAGAVAIWTKADSVTHFDDLTFLPSAKALLARDPFELGAFEDCKDGDEARLRHALMTLADPRAGFHAGELHLREVRDKGSLPAKLWEQRREPQHIREALADAKDWKDLLVRGAIEERLGDARAMRTYEQVLAARPACIEALLGRARLRLAQGKKEAAQRDVELALALHPGSPRTLVFLAKVTQDAAVLDRVDPRYVPAHLARGTLHLMAGRAEEAIKAYDRAIELDPDGPAGYYNRCLAWQSAGNHDRAMKDARRAAELGPELADPPFQVGRLYTLQGDLDGAEKEFKRALELDAAHMKAILGLGWVESHRGRWAEAIKLYDRAIELDPSVVEAWTLRGNAKWKSGLVEECIGDYTKAIEVAPAFARAYANRGMAFAKQEKWGRAVRDFERAIELEPKLKEVLRDDLETARKAMKDY